MDTTISLKRRRLLGAAAASLALPAFAETPAHDGVSRMTTQGNYLAVRPDWLASALEPALEPGLPIVDAHHHFYERPGWIYMLDDYLQDARSGHNIQASVYMQAQTRYRDSGPAELKPVGETAYVAGVTEPLQHGPVAVAKGIVGHADLRLGERVRDVLEAHLEAGRGRFRGVRHLTTWDADPTLANPLSAVPRGLLLDPAYRAGVAQLAPLGLSYDAWLFFPQLPELFELAKANPETRIIVNHCGGVVRIASYADKRPEVFERWSASMRTLAQLPNVYVKVGGLGMRINGFDFEKGAKPPSSAQLADTWKPWMMTCIDAFGPGRCMFEGNFPVDKGSYSFVNGWNAFKRLTAQASADERDALFRGTVTRAYRLG